MKPTDYTTYELTPDGLLHRHLHMTKDVAYRLIVRYTSNAQRIRTMQCATVLDAQLLNDALIVVGAEFVRSKYKDGVITVSAYVPSQKVRGRAFSAHEVPHVMQVETELLRIVETLGTDVLNFDLTDARQVALANALHYALAGLKSAEFHLQEWNLCQALSHINGASE